ncbi:hypothetical protein ACGRHY_27245 [Streptomyces sp. HK10]|uniref:hypothetical protein n=1 Tax=Streptomyces sp. HK10 TaxID=3373255 RepID=UPI0037486237
MTADVPLPDPIFPSLEEFVRLAGNSLTATSPAARRTEAVAAARALLAEAIGLPLKDLTPDELVTVVLHLRAGLARLLAAVAPAAVAHHQPPEEEDDTLIASLFHLLGDTAGLAAEVDVHVGRPLPASRLSALIHTIRTPDLQVIGDQVEATGICGSSTVHITAAATNDR